MVNGTFPQPPGREIFAGSKALSAASAAGEIPLMPLLLLIFSSWHGACKSLASRPVWENRTGKR
jgi:hypothetical protein